MSWLHYRWVVFAGTLLACTILFVGCGMITNGLVKRQDRIEPRDAETGIIVGCEPLTLGPEDASTGVLFIHGFLGGSNNFENMPYEVAEKGCRVRAMLLPGHGTSPFDLEYTTVDQMLDAVREEVAAMRAKHDTVILVTHSMGASLAILTASEIDVDGLVMAAAYFGITDKWYYGLSPETWTRIGSPLIRWVYKGRIFLQVNRTEAKKDIMTYKWVPTKSILTLMELSERVNAPGILEATSCPVLMIHAKGDLAANPDDAAAAFERIGSKDKRVVWLTNSNHVIFWDNERDVVDAAVLGFIEARCE